MRVWKKTRFYSVEITIKGKKYRRSTGLTTYRAAKKRALEIVAELEAQVVGLDAGAPDNKTLREHVAAYLQRMEDRKLSKSHRKRVSYHLGAYLASSKVGSLPDVTEFNVRAWLRSANSAAVWNHRRASLFAFLRWVGAPIPDVPKQNQDADRHYERSPLSLDELKRLLNGPAPLYRRVAYGLAATAGLRRAEIDGLEWKHLDLEGGYVTVRASISKNSKDATLPIHPFVLPLLVEWREMLGDYVVSGGMRRWLNRRKRLGKELVVPPPRNPTFNRDLLDVGIGQADRPIDLGVGRSAQVFQIVRPTGEHIDFHALRGTCATLALEAGAAPGVVQKLLRHSSFALTDKHYSRLNLDAKRAAQKAIDL